MHVSKYTKTGLANHLLPYQFVNLLSNSYISTFGIYSNSFFVVTGILASTWLGLNEIRTDFINATSRFVGSVRGGEKDISGEGQKAKG